MVDFQLCSDLHLEMRGGLRAGIDAYPTPVAPVMVLAGDIYPAGAPEFTEILKRATEGFQLALYVPGNHEYYGCIGGMEQLEAMVSEKANSISNVFCLNKRSLNIGNVNFIGATLWTNPPKSVWGEGVAGFNDYHAIRKPDGSAYTPSDLCSFHKKHAAYLQKALGAAKKTGASSAVIVTHHVPDVRLSLETGSRPHNLFPFYFASDMQKMVTDPFVRIWCHGHSHESHCIRLDPWGPLFACNARGYPGERTGFVNDAVLGVR